MKPAENANSAKMKPIAGSAFEKNCAAMTPASEPKSTKSYHSNTVPSEEAMMTLRSCALNRPLVAFASIVASLMAWPH